jgi:uncharacterized protein (TIGR02453 family)
LVGPRLEAPRQELLELQIAVGRRVDEELRRPSIATTSIRSSGCQRSRELPCTRDVAHNQSMPERSSSSRARGRAAKRTGYFGPGLFEFLRGLAAHNERVWFDAHRDDYERHVRGPMLTFISDLGARLAEVSAFVVADPRPQGGSMFRIYRDTRFSKEKTPYKTNVGAQFRHKLASRDVHAPGFYLHLEPGEVYIGGGLWHPEAAALAKVRARIVNKPAEWRAVVRGGLVVEGDALKRPPTGFDPAHPHIEHLKLKDFYTGRQLTEVDACAPDFLDRFLEECQRAAPLLRFLCKSLELPW